MKKYVSLLLICFISINAWSASMSGRQKLCKEKLLKEFKNALSSDHGLIQAQLSLTAMKLAQKVLKRRGLREQSVESYIQDVVGEKTLSRLDKNQSIQQDILNLYHEHSKNKKFFDAKDDLKQLSLNALTQLNDEQLSRYMIQMQSIWKGVDDFGFDEKDYAMGWFVNMANKNATGKDSYFISNAVKEVLKDIDQADKKIAKNFKHAQLKLKGELEKLKMKVFARHKEICLDFYDSEDNPYAQNVSIYENITCGYNEQQLVEDVFLESLKDLLNHDEFTSYEPAPLKLQSIEKKNPKEIRRWQDWINQQPSSKERIVEYYKNGLADTNCDGFIIVDKKNKKTSLYLNDGSEVVTSPTIIGEGVLEKEDGQDIIFNPDSILRKWPKEGGGYKYSKTTGAGTFYVDKSLSKKEREDRDYGKEFNDRVLVIYSKNKQGNREEIQAVHGVPNDNWVGNRDERMTSFESADSNKKLSTGCVNLEGYSYDVMDQFLGHQCPMYILPEDEKNYYQVKNGKLKFNTSKLDRKKQREFASDDKNVNLYNYTAVDKKLKVSSFKLKQGQSNVLEKIFKDKEELNKRAVNMESDDFQDFAALTYAITDDPQKAKKIFLNLYNSSYRFKNQSRPKNIALYDLAPTKEKRRVLLETYKKEFGGDYNIQKLLLKAQEVEFAP